MSLPSTLKLSAPRSPRILGLPLLLVGIVPVAMAVDMPLAKWFVDHQLIGDAAEILTIAETFGHGIGAIWILIAVWSLAPQLRRAIPFMATASLGAGLAANLVKLVISRERPRAIDIGSVSVLDTFGGTFPFLDAGPSGQSFPSSHSATAVGLAVALAVSFPRGRRLFVTAAVLACVSRMAVGAHYLSDVLVGAAIGLVIGRLSMLRSRRMRLSRPSSGQAEHQKHAA